MSLLLRTGGTPQWVVERVAPANLFAGTWLSFCKYTNSFPFTVVRLPRREIVRQVVVTARLDRISCGRGEGSWLLESFDGPAQEVETTPRKWGAVHLCRLWAYCMYFMQAIRNTYYSVQDSARPIRGQHTPMRRSGIQRYQDRTCGSAQISRHKSDSGTFVKVLKLPILTLVCATGHTMQPFRQPCHSYLLSSFAKPVT